MALLVSQRVYKLGHVYHSKPLACYKYNAPHVMTYYNILSYTSGTSRLDLPWLSAAPHQHQRRPPPPPLLWLCDSFKIYGPLDPRVQSFSVGKLFQFGASTSFSHMPTPADLSSRDLSLGIYRKISVCNKPFWYHKKSMVVGSKTTPQ